jgi:hypothetical protein
MARLVGKNGAETYHETECCFPRCYAPVTTKIELPLCDDHCLTVFSRMQALMNHYVDAPEDFDMPRRAFPEDEPRPSVVYFLRFGDRIKIGYSANLTRRLQTIPHDEVLLTIPGASTAEANLHRTFASDRITGEWFHASPRLLAAIRDLTERQGSSRASV